MDLHIICIVLISANFVSSNTFRSLQFINTASKDPNDVQFFLYPNQADPSDKDEIIYNNVSSLQNSRLDPTKSIILITHGFNNNYSSTPFPQIVKDSYLEAGFIRDWNIIVTNWGLLSSPKEYFSIPIVNGFTMLPVYIQAVQNAYVVGKRIQELLIFFQQNNYLLNGGQSVHLVGHSLGSHVSGMAGFYWKNITGTLLKRISGNDPAKPGFQFRDVNLRLDETDAEFVDVYHTNQGVQGYVGAMGHVDFFPNGGGPLQPECSITDVGCPHGMAPKYFAKSILDNSIKACPKKPSFFPSNPTCTEDKQVTYGQYCPPTARGSYELTLRL